jgi:hypothetical protein
LEDDSHRTGGYPHDDFRCDHFNLDAGRFVKIPPISQGQTGNVAYGEIPAAALNARRYCAKTAFGSIQEVEMTNCARRLGKTARILVSATVLLTCCSSYAWAQFPGFAITSPTEFAALTTSQDVPVKWTGGDPSDLVNILLIDIPANTAIGGWGPFPNTGTNIVPFSTLPQLKCAHSYKFYVANTQVLNFTYGPSVTIVCEDQTVAGVVTATAFVGDGSGLTGITAATANTANFATSAGSANTAGNAAALGGLLPGSYARVDIGNAFTGSQSIVGDLTQTGNLATTGTVTIGGGTPIVKHLSASFDPGFPTLKPGVCATADFPFSGLADGDTLALGVPSSRLTGGGVLQYFAWVSASNTVTLRVCNIAPNSAQKTVATGSIRVDVWKH